MGISKVFKKKGNVPDELPDLAVDELKNNLKDAFSDKGTEAPKEEAPAESAAPAEETPTESTPTEEAATAETSAEGEQPAANEETTSTKSRLDPEKSFFAKILKGLDEEDGDDLNKLNELYDKNFVKKDPIKDMKNHWKKQKDKLIVKSIGDAFKKKISLKVQKLQELESEWQSKYFELIEKEEEMRKEEKEIKKLIQEFANSIGKKDYSSKEQGNIKKSKTVNK